MSDAQQLFGVGLGMEAADRARSRGGFALQRRHEDGHRWVDVRHFPTKPDARAALEELVANGEERED